MGLKQMRARWRAQFHSVYFPAKRLWVGAPKGHIRWPGLLQLNPSQPLKIGDDNVAPFHPQQALLLQF